MIKTVTPILLIFLRIQHKDVFELIKKHNLYDEIYQKIVPLIQLDSEQAIAMLLQRNKIAPEVVIEQLKNHEEYLYMVRIHSTHILQIPGGAQNYN